MSSVWNTFPAYTSLWSDITLIQLIIKHTQASRLGTMQAAALLGILNPQWRSLCRTQEWAHSSLGAASCQRGRNRSTVAFGLIFCLHLLPFKIMSARGEMHGFIHLAVACCRHHNMQREKSVSKMQWYISMKPPPQPDQSHTPIQMASSERSRRD